MESPREKTERLEGEYLSPYAAKSAESRGRHQPETPCPFRTIFQRDRDRIIHCKAFRRLSHKTQVFIAPEEDHYRTRLTHTLEVAQIARTISRALRLNEDLTEAIALGHDLGHTPFGHAGEAALEAAYCEFDTEARFRHAEQSLRVVEALEKDGAGLNLSYEVKEGIRRHSKGMEDLPAKEGPDTLEGAVVLYADRIAYINHDIDDAIRAGLITADNLPQDCIDKLGASHAQRITTMVADIVSESDGVGRIDMSERVVEATNRLKDFVYERIYQAAGSSSGEAERVERTMKELFRFYMKRPEEMSMGRDVASLDRKELARVVCDYVAGMTDRFALQQLQEHFIPRRWRVWE